MIGLAHDTRKVSIPAEAKTHHRKTKQVKKSRSKKRQEQASKKRQEQANKVFFHKKLTVSLNLTMLLLFVTRLGNS